MQYVIAGLAVELAANGTTAARAEAYKASAPRPHSDMRIAVDAARLLAEKPEFESEDMTEYLATGDCFAVGLLAHGGMVLHASAVVYDGEAVCFSAPPGVGKSTLAARWERMFRARVLNDDKPALRRDAVGAWRVYGTPWSGKEDKSINADALLKAICFLYRGAENAIAPLTAQEALPLLLSQTPFRLERAGMERLLATAEQLLHEVPMYRLVCRNDDSAAQFAREQIYHR